MKAVPAYARRVALDHIKRGAGSLFTAPWPAELLELDKNLILVGAPSFDDFPSGLCKSLEELIRLFQPGKMAGVFYREQHRIDDAAM
jgi:hypothetical protein